jgi:hypothetical protein
MHFQGVAYTTLTVRQDVAKRLRANRGVGESYSDVLNRLLDNQPAKTVGEWLESLAPIEGRALFTPEERARLSCDQKSPRDSSTRRKGHASS